MRTITIRVNEDELLQFKTLAKKKGISLTTLVKSLIHDKYELESQPSDIFELAEQLKDLKKEIKSDMTKVSNMLSHNIFNTVKIDQTNMEIIKHKIGIKDPENMEKRIKAATKREYKIIKRDVLANCNNRGTDHEQNNFSL